MKSLFIVGAKLLGIWLLYISILGLVSTFLIMDSSEESFLVSWFLTYAISLVIGIVGGALLALKTDWLAGVVGLKNSNSTVRWSVDERTLLSVGIRLVGLFLMIDRLGGVVVFIGQRAGGFYSADLWEIVRDILLVWIYLLPLYLIFGWRRITDILDRPVKVVEQTQESVS